MSQSEYALGHTDRDFERLQLQASCLEGLTRRLVRECGIEPGMRVLDIGCGAGDVSMLLAEAVGPSGTVVGVDVELRAVQLAKRRACEAGLDQAQFAVGTDEHVEPLGPFDAVIGRCVLVHQVEPTKMIRRVSSAVRTGGIVGFFEPAFHAHFYMTPEVPLMRAVCESIINCHRAALQSPDVAGRFISCFLDSGLPEPRVNWESIAPGSDPKFVRWIAVMYETLLPLMESSGTVDPNVGDFASLYDRLLSALTEGRTQFTSVPYVSAWATKN